jgi:outer membrane protein assembly factor BamA
VTQSERTQGAPTPRRDVSHHSFLVVLAAALLPSSASADQTLNSSEKPDPSAHVTAAGKTDFNLVPIAGGSTDIGIGGGVFAGLTRLEPGYVPYRWDAQGAAFVTFANENGGLIIPYLDAYVLATLPRFAGTPVKLEVRPGMTRETTLDYYGMGNASSAAAPTMPGVSTYRYERTHPSMLADARVKLVDHLDAMVGFRYTLSSQEFSSESKLAYDLRHGSPEVKALIGPTGTESVPQLLYAVELDTRDSEVTPRSGTFDELALRLSPGGTSDFPSRYGEATLSMRGYVPLVSSRVVLAARLVGDLLFGQPPFYVLSCIEDQYALGGSNGVRGVPAQRYYGKVKIMANLEARIKLFEFRAFSKAVALGAAAFFDGGRVWADTTPHPELDGTGFGLKYGVGAGLRLTSGVAFVLRADIAYSPDATPVGGYVAAGEAF